MGRDQEISGSLRFTSTEIFLNGYLGPHLWTFLRAHPDIELHLACTQTLLSIGEVTPTWPSGSRRSRQRR